MNKTQLILLSILPLLIFWSCADSVSDLTTKDVTVTVKESNLTIRNNFNHSIYYFAVESGVAAVINWAPISTDENRIRPRSTKRIPLNEIHAFNPGNEILVYYWSEKEPDNKNIKFQRVETE